MKFGWILTENPFLPNSYHSYQILTNPTKFRSEFGRTCRNAWGSVKYLIGSSVWGSSCMDRKNNWNRTEPDWRLWLHAFQNEKTTKNHPQPDWLQLVAAGFRYSLNIHTFWAYFEEKQAINACARAKTICYGKIQLCVMSCSCIFWHAEYFYHHKNYMVRYYTLYSIFYSWFFTQRYQF